ncbi:MAG: Ig-like domain-containing protein [Candidatus Desantisbacteria bacterium]
MRNVLAIFIAIIFSFNTMAYARELKGVVSGNANDVYSATFKFSADNTDQQLLKKDNSPLNFDDVCSYYNTIDGMKIFVDGIDIASSKYSYPKKIMGLDLSDVAGWPRINIPAGCVGIDPKLGRFKFSEGNNDSPTLLSTFDTYDVAYGVSVVDTVAFVASFRSGLYALDVTNPKKPLLINNYNTTGWAYDVCVKNGYAFVADAYSGLQIIDVSNPKNLTLVGNCATNGWAYDIFVEGRYAYLADYRLGLQIIDVQNPAKPEIVGNCRTDSTAYGVWVLGQYAYLADGVSGLRIIDISNPDSPRLVSTYDTKGKAYDVQVVGKYAFVADGQCSGLQIIDVSNPAAPKLVGCCTTPGIASKIHVLDGYAYIADGQNSGLQIINVSDVNNPIIVASCKTSGKAYGIFLSGKNAFVADGSNGLHIIDVPHPCEAPKGKVTVDCLLASNAYFSIDSTPPVVTGVFPSNKLAAVPVDTDVVINFSEIMNPSLTEASFGISPDPGTRAYKWSNDGKTITIDLQRFSYDSLYNCVVTTQSVDLCGNHLPQSYTWSFYTEKQATTTLQSTLFSPTPAGGNEYDITWQITGGKPPYLIDLYYSTDGGKVYLPITQNTIGTSYRWRVTQVNFNDVKLKVVAIDASGAQVNSVNPTSRL